MSHDSLTIRPLAEPDATTFKALRLEAIANSPTAIWPTFAEEQAKTLDVVAVQIRQTDRQVVFGAFEHDALVAITGVRREALTQTSHKAILWGVFVRPAYRRSGVARKLLNRAFAHAREQGTRQILLAVNTENHRARQLYQSIGFAGYGIEPRALCVDGRYYDEEHMVMYLDH
jgi:ribosomal protein S18 acetylase RimI-like enzyme